MKIAIIISYLLLLTILFSACASTGFLMGKAKATIFGETYPGKDTDAKIDIYLTNKPTREYIEFVRITCSDTNEKWSLEQIKKKVREIGADGIIIIGQAGTTGVGMPIGTSTFVFSEGYGMTAIAIKYK